MTNPFFFANLGGHPTYDVCVQDRLSRVLYFDLDQCRAALALPDLQDTVRRAVERRQRALEKASRAGASRRSHTCHWPGCTQPVAPAMWGCRAHWFRLPLHLRNRIWAAYVGGQEITQTPSAEYLEAARAAQEWIAALPRVTQALAAIGHGPDRGR